MPLVRSDLRKLATNLEVVDDIAPDLLDATDDGLVTTRTIVAQRSERAATIIAVAPARQDGRPVPRDENRADAVRWPTRR